MAAGRADREPVLQRPPGSPGQEARPALAALAAGIQKLLAVEIGVADLERQELVPARRRGNEDEQSCSRHARPVGLEQPIAARYQ
jgi:hypothetical protein